MKKITKILDDRQFLDVLKMSDDVAARILGRSRQALHQKLGKSRQSPGAKGRSKGAFKPCDMLALVNGAVYRKVNFDRKLVKNYIVEIYDDADQEEVGPLLQFLDPSRKISAASSERIVFILPAYAKLVRQRPMVRESFVDLVNSASPGTKINILAHSDMWSEAAGQALGVSAENCVAHDNVQHYVDTVIIFGFDGDPDSASIYMLSDGEGLVEAPQWHTDTLAECTLDMLSSHKSEEKPPIRISAAL